MCTIADFDSINATAITSLTVVSTSNTTVAVCSPLTSNITVTSSKTGTVSDMHMNEKGKSSPCRATRFVCCTSRWNCSYFFQDEQYQFSRSYCCFCYDCYQT